MSAAYAMRSQSLASAVHVVWTLALCVRSVNTVAKKIAYYALGTILAVVPFLMYLGVIVAIAQIPTYFEWQLAMTMPFGVLLVAYYVWMFED